MRVLRYHKQAGVQLGNLSLRPLQPKSVRIKLIASGVCATDMKIIDNQYYNKKVLKDDVVLGHEGCGIVEKVSTGSSHLKVGDHVVFETVRPCGTCQSCRSSLTNFCENWKHIGINQDGTYAAYIDIEQQQVHKIPGDIPWRASVLTEPLAIALHSLRDLREVHCSNMAIVGPGIIGLLHLIVFKQHYDVDIDVFGLDRDAERLSSAIDKGAHAVSTKEMTRENSSIKYDLVIDTSGTALGFKKALSLTSVGGTCRTLSLSTEEALSASDLVKSGVTMNSGRGITKMDMENAVLFLKHNHALLDGLCTHCYPLIDYLTAFNNVRSGVGIKSVFQH
ncbi:alcohol dehydrogenase catalytic domain-containing protein [Vibrio tubiashii]|uniref:zinc-dependent alcohol dehydrogenase n=1 Tax=Vibrio tubiashii TaxID=29498 RepID=UPI001EFD65D5|nr:alcohol dehydrogenase catalytic domain-containing protein [Vibrio tubiashii]MCG9583673.1 alcohol dehydrogenase catalytic domain-containing protein [Vibrio tubiashii]MCG9617251.1 alcohol dehydrogenase catalytic domain-containing protein [Vibrio tubiashii]MCG9689813.1 alcohol dehydrogenase catalytic domain-containing protein [Vibrio tubiashii]